MMIKIDINDHIPSNLRAMGIFITKKLKKHGYDAYLVGGSVRDMLLGKKCSDLDFTTNATPQKIMKIFPHNVPVGIEFGTVLVLYGKIKAEVTTYRADLDYQDGRHPNKIIFGKTLKEDVLRRDFTINGMAYDIEQKVLFDYVGGLDDLKKKNIRTIGSSIKRFREDGLRPIRACRFAASLSFLLDSEIFYAIAQSQDVIRKVARERFYDEWRKTMLISKKNLFWELLYKTKINFIFLDFFLIWQNREKSQFFFNFLKFARPTHMGMYLAYLLYFEYADQLNCDVMKNKVNQVKEKLHCSSADIKIAFEYLDSPLFKIIKKVQLNLSTQYPLAYFFSEIHEERIHDHIHFFSEIYSYKKNKISLASNIKKTMEVKLLNMQKKEIPLQMSKLKVNGNDLKILGYQKINIGNQLRRLHKIVIRHPKLNNKEYLLKLSRKKKSN